jgi:hypothetical protein
VDAAIAAAVPEAQAELAGQAPPASAEPVEATVVEPAAERTTEVEEPPAPTTPETPDPALDQAVETETEPVDEYLFGISLNSIPEAERATFIKEWTEQNKLIQKLQRANAEPETPAPAPAVETQPTVADLSDEDIARAAGLDPEDLDAPGTRVAIAALRGYAELKGEVAQLSTSTNASETQRVWEKALDQLDADYGELPVDRGRLLEIAASEGITDPEAAYWRVAGPVRAEVMKALEAKLATSQKTAKKAATSPRPATSASVEDKVKAVNVKDAVKEIAEAEVKRLGLNLSGN